jgi:capsular polysaccharide biosynthesis protein
LSRRGADGRACARPGVWHGSLPEDDRNQEVAVSQVTTLVRTLRGLARSGRARLGRDEREAPLPRGERPVVLLAVSDTAPAVAKWRRRFPADAVHVVSPAKPPVWDFENTDPRAQRKGPVSQVSAAVRQLGALDAIVDLLPPAGLPGEARSREKLFRRLFGYVGKGGVYVVDRDAVHDSEGTVRLSALLEGLSGATSEDPDAELARAVEAFHVGRDRVVVSKGVRHYIKLRDQETDRVLPSREPDLRLSCLVELPAGELRSRATVSSHGHYVRSLPQTLRYPELHLRHYEGDVVLGGRTLMFTGNTVLPDSFHHHLNRRINHPRLESVDATTARIRPRFRPSRVLDGPFYQLDSTFTGHFGHVMTEVVSRLWGWDTARDQQPDLRAIMFRRAHRPLRPDFELRLLHAFGIEEEQVVWVDEPVQVSSVVSATPMWHNADPLYVHPDLVRTWERLTAGLLKDAPDMDVPDRIFVSRSAKYRDRTCRNLGSVEDVFVRHGFQVVHPEEHSLAEQALIFSRASHVAGLGGSAMCNLMHSKRLESAVILNHGGYIARNEHLFTALTGGQVHYFWSPPDAPLPRSGFSKESFKSSWEFDFAQHGARLEELLGSL